MNNAIYHKWKTGCERMGPVRSNKKQMGSPRDYIVRRIKREGTNPNKLAKDAGMNPSTVHRILNEPEIETRASTLKPLARYWKVSVQEIMNGGSSPDLRTVQSNPLDDMDPEEIKAWIIANYPPENLKDLAMDALMAAARADLKNQSK